jgi:hypothetical protein
MKLIDMVKTLQSKAITAGTTMEFSENVNAAELLSDLVSDVVDDTNEILNLLKNN